MSDPDGVEAIVFDLNHILDFKKGEFFQRQKIFIFENIENQNKESIMPGTFSQIYIQIVFAVRGRRSLIQAEFEEDLHKYITGIVRNKDQKMLAINGMPDHIHFLIGMRPSCCLSDLIREIKKASNEFVNDKKLAKFKFQWQEGYGAFSYSHNDLDHVIAYIGNQKVHHQRKSFREEYKEFLVEFQVEHKDEYLFDWIE